MYIQPPNIFYIPGDASFGNTKSQRHSKETNGTNNEPKQNDATIPTFNTQRETAHSNVKTPKFTQTFHTADPSTKMQQPPDTENDGTAAAHGTKGIPNSHGRL